MVSVVVADAEEMTLFVLGALAGLGVAMPLGAIGVLLIREGVVAGFRRAAAGALAVALVDTGYCVLAVAAGSVAGSWIRSLGALPAAVSGIVLIALGALGLAHSGTAAGAPGAPRSRSPVAAFVRFAALTAINPATLLYFVALAATLTSTLQLNGTLLPFVAGVAVTSLAWQLGLVGVGAVLGGRLGLSGQRRLSVLGFGIVVALGVAALVAAGVQLVGT